MILAFKGIIPPEYWMHDIDMYDRRGDSIKSNLLKYGYAYINN